VSARRTASRASIGLVLGATAVVLASSPVAASDDEPELDVWPISAAPGEMVQISGVDWPSLEMVQVEVCGGGERAQSNDCAHSTARSIATTRAGELIGRLEVALPPTPCPCVIRAWVPGGSSSQVASFVVSGAPYEGLAEPDDLVEPVARVEVRASLTGDDSVAAWFGAPPERTLVLELENLTDERVDGLRLRADWGRGEGADGMIDVPELPPLEPGRTESIEVPVRLGPLSLGDFVVAGEIRGEPGTEFLVRTGSFPWALAAIPALILLQWALLKLRNVLRRRVRDRRAAHEVVQALPVTGVAGDIAPEDGPGETVPGDPPSPVPDEAALGPAADAPAGDAEHSGGGTPAAGDPAADREPVLVGSSSGSSRTRTAGGLALAAVAGFGFWIARGVPDPVDHKPLDAETFCEQLVDMDVVSALAGDHPPAKARAIVALVALADRAPEEVRVPLAIIRREAAERPGLEEAVEADPEDGEAWATTWRALYRIQFDADFVAAATRVEKYAVEQCSMEPSGVFDLDVSYFVPSTDPATDLANAIVPEARLDIGSMEAQRQAVLSATPTPEVSFDDVRLHHESQLEVVEPPEFVFDTSDWEVRYGPG
jgi:hypothetical protein